MRARRRERVSGDQAAADRTRSDRSGGRASGGGGDERSGNDRGGGGNDRGGGSGGGNAGGGTSGGGRPGGGGSGKGRNRKRRNRKRRNPKGPRNHEVGFWGETSRLPEPTQDVRITDDPAAVARSLGAPPLPGHEKIAEHYFRVVYERGVQTAGALAAAGGLIDPEALAQEFDQ